jgi:hypothetical protein
MKSQNATATLGNITSCAGETVLVPIDVMDFNDVGAMTFYIGYDTNTAEFLSIQNVNPAIPGWISANASNGQVGIAYTYTEPFFITGEKLFDLSFTYFGDSTSLTFNSGTEIATTMLEIIPLDTYPGSLANSILITGQPENVQSYPDNDVTFGVSSTGDINFQWQENSGNGWINLQNNNTYSGVTTDTLTISDVTLDFNGNTYRCELSAGECTELTDIALLEVADAFPVATLGLTSSCPENEILEPMLVGDFFDVIEFNFNIAFNTDLLVFQSLENIYPGLNSGSFTISPLEDPAGISIHWTGSVPVSIANGTLFDLNFYYLAQNQNISFATGTFVLNSSSNPVNITLNDGEILQYAIPVFIAQPEDETVMELEDAFFEVVATGADQYHWMISTDSGGSWTDLSNTPPYFNTQTAMLKISPATYDMDGNVFACRINSEYCNINSTSAVLSVDTLTGIAESGQKVNLKVSPVPFRNSVKVDLQSFNSVKAIRIVSLQGINCFTYTLYNIYTEIANLDLSSLTEGVYILKVDGTINGQEVSAQRLIYKAY